MLSLKCASLYANLEFGNAIIELLIAGFCVIGYDSDRGFDTQNREHSVKFAGPIASQIYDCRPCFS